MFKLTWKFSTNFNKDDDSKQGDASFNFETIEPYKLPKIYVLIKKESQISIEGNSIKYSNFTEGNFKMERGGTNNAKRYRNIKINIENNYVNIKNKLTTNVKYKDLTKVSDKLYKVTNKNILNELNNLIQISDSIMEIHTSEANNINKINSIFLTDKGNGMFDILLIANIGFSFNTTSSIDNAIFQLNTSSSGIPLQSYAYCFFTYSKTINDEKGYDNSNDNLNRIDPSATSKNIQPSFK